MGGTAIAYYYHREEGASSTAESAEEDCSIQLSQCNYLERHSRGNRGTFLLGFLMCSVVASTAHCHIFRESAGHALTPRPGFIGSGQKRIPNSLSGRSFSSELRASKVDEILADLKTLTLLETSELVKKIEETFGVSASMAVSAAAPAAGGAPVLAAAAAAPEEEEEEEKPKKSSFEVVLLERPEDQSVRMALFRALRKVMPDKPLTDVKAAIDNAPTVVAMVNKESEAKEAIKIIEGAGGKGEIR